MSSATLSAAAALFLAASPMALADQCTAMTGKTTTMCLSATYNTIPNNRYTVTYGPANAFSGVGASKSTQGVTFQGTYTCQGNDFYTTQYAVSDGEQNYWIARFPNTVAGSGSDGFYFTGKLKTGACP